MVNWFIEIFNFFQEDIIDQYDEIFEETIKSLDFKEQNVTSWPLGLMNMSVACEQGTWDALYAFKDEGTLPEKDH